MSFEIEVKYRSVDHSRMLQLLQELGARPTTDEEQVDSYLNHPSRDFAASNEAFRIRRIGAQNRITYKGPRQPGPTKTREEIEIVFEAGDEAYLELGKLCDHLGFRRVAEVSKRRRSFAFNHQGIELTVGLDNVDGLGEFVEVEAIAANDSEIPAAQAAILDLASRLGLGVVEPRSYLRMILERRDSELGASGVGSSESP